MEGKLGAREGEVKYDVVLVSSSPQFTLHGHGHSYHTCDIFAPTLLLFVETQGQRRGLCEGGRGCGGS